jgi:hypothetical protein
MMKGACTVKFQLTGGATHPHPVHPRRSHQPRFQPSRNAKVSNRRFLLVVSAVIVENPADRNPVVPGFPVVQGYCKE